VQQINRHKELCAQATSGGGPEGNFADSSEPGVSFEETVAAILPATISADDVRSYVDAKPFPLQRFVDSELYFRHTAEILPATAFPQKKWSTKSLSRL